MKTILLIALVLGAAYVAATLEIERSAAQYEDLELPDQTTDFLDDAIVTFTPSTYETVTADADAQAVNTRAFLDMLAYSEGTGSPDGYRAMFGYPRRDRIVSSLADHPRQYFSFTDSTGRVQKTSAAGRYQFLARTWDELAKKLGLPDFGPDSQDAAALELVRQRGALGDVRAGRITAAVAKCAKTWASLPGAGYNQPERKMDSLLSAYRGAGGYFEA
nr:glycoside hydrolase family 104 protein [uncultured Albidiferax sp.]